MKNEAFSRKMNKRLAAVCSSNVILKNGQEHLVCLYYDKENFDAPVVRLKASNQFNDYFLKAANSLNIPCLENKLLAKHLFDESDERKLIPEKYEKTIAEIYSALPRFSSENETDKFNKELRYDTLLTLQGLEGGICKSAGIKIFKKRKGAAKTRLDDDEILELVEERLETLADEYILNLKVTDTLFGGREFFIGYLPVADDPKYDFWQTFIVSLAERKTYVGGKIRFRAFDIEDVGLALDYYTALFSVCKDKLPRDAQVYCKEFEINFKSYEIAQNTVKTLLEANRKNTGIDYSFYSNKAVMKIYLQKNSGAQNPKKYMVTITYNAFLRDPAVFKDFIANPRPKNAWNFWCRETTCG